MRRVGAFAPAIPCPGPITRVRLSPTAIASVELPRAIYVQGLETLKQIGLGIMVVALLFIVLSVMAVDRVLFFRLRRLENGILEIAKYEDFSKRIPVEGNDELALVEEVQYVLKDLSDFD